MSNINLGQFFNNLSSNIGRMAADSLQNAAMQENSAYTEQQINANMKTLFPNTTAQLSQTAAELALLNQSQTINMVKDLLNMPKNMEQLISQLTLFSANSSQTAELLLSSNLDLSQLSSLLQNSSKTALTNLYQLVAQYNQLGMSLKDEQLGEISKLISFVSASSSSDVQSLKTSLLLYLPWLPLTDPDAFKLSVEENQTSSGSAGEDSVTVLISTKNYGNLQCSILKTKEDGINIDITSSETFPRNDLTSLMQEESKKYNVNINIEYTVKASFNKEKNEPKTQVCMNISSGLNPFLIIISCSVIKNVHLIDSKENLRELRKEKL